MLVELHTPADSSLQNRKITIATQPVPIQPQTSPQTRSRSTRTIVHPPIVFAVLRNHTLYLFDGILLLSDFVSILVFELGGGRWWHETSHLGVCMFLCVCVCFFVVIYSRKVNENIVPTQVLLDGISLVPTVALGMNSL
jgi:hypothetical protein